MQVNIHEAKTTLSKLIQKVASGETVVISRYGKPTAKLVPWEEPPKRRIGGRDRGRFKVPDDFDQEDEQINQLFDR
ncbi:MAG: type II toxin-antitoxin system Phd/YefM family antitoxin [Oceanipulchritudo sp.]